ncbi:hypothetical protein PR048_001678 [Dryococelus australis]|uniref:Pentatricopeptide repeat-containing protein n=1 Tax=Dryococelus australis TaxID=614101 RepID=A0ABQ9IJE9_9NEOP|nr:hypothetical protein PR048_001678 [Dryococelus australis]
MECVLIRFRSAENLLTANNIRLGYVVRHVIKKEKLPEADIIEQTYELVCSSEDSKALLSSFSREGRFDHLWLHILKAHSFSAKSCLLKFEEMLVLSHGNATLE